jgi:hypothetical protein
MPMEEPGCLVTALVQPLRTSLLNQEIVSGQSMESNSTEACYAHVLQYRNRAALEPRDFET